jgi:hypothetical protein
MVPRQERRQLMRPKTIAALTLGTVLFVAPHAFALGDGKSRSGSGTVTINGTTVTGSANGIPFQGTCSNGQCTGTYTVAAAEPFAALALGLGLLGARYLRRRR